MERFAGQRGLRPGVTVKLFLCYYGHDLFVKHSMRLWKTGCSFWSLHCVFKR
jgi:hypothetical protein